MKIKYIDLINNFKKLIYYSIIKINSVSILMLCIKVCNNNSVLFKMFVISWSLKSIANKEKNRI
jgi:hypothetical protein